MPGIVKSIQRIAIGVTGGSGGGDATITAVNLAKTFVTWDGFEYTGTEAYNSTDPKNWLAYVDLTATTNARLQRPGTGNVITSYNQVVEFF